VSINKMFFKSLVDFIYLYVRPVSHECGPDRNVRTLPTVRETLVSN